MEVNEDGVLGTPPVAQPPVPVAELVVPPRLPRVSDLSSRTGGSIRPTNPTIGSGRPGHAINPLAASSVEELLAELERRNVPLDFASAASRSSSSCILSVVLRQKVCLMLTTIIVTVVTMYCGTLLG